MKVHIVTEGGWILRRIADELKDNLGWSISSEIDPKADINYFVNYALLKEKCPTDVVAFFTHRDPGLIKEWKRAENLCNVAVYMCDQHSPDMDFSLKLPVTGSDYKIGEEFIIGISGRPYKDGRKGDEIYKRLDLRLNSSLPITWKVMGNGWEEIFTKRPLETIEWKSDEEAIEFYKSLDVLLTLSNLEGGPVCNFEAMKLGVPIISTPVGGVEFWGKHATIVNGTGDAMEALLEMIHSKEERIQLSEMNWEWFANEHEKFFKELHSI